MISVGEPTSFFTDRYELTMLRAALAAGTAHRRCVFEVFARGLPPGRRYGVVAGTGRMLVGLSTFRFSETQIDYLLSTGVIDDPTATFLSEYSFDGDVYGYAEGDMYFPQSPVLTIEADFAHACVLETYILSVLNHDSAIASAASRMVCAAAGRPCIEMGSRRTHESAAVAAARAACIAGFASTSNLRAGHDYGVKTVGTAAHSFALLFDTEAQAFSAQLQALGRGTTVLVDTYDVMDAVRQAVQIAGPELGAVRLDSGDLIAQAKQVRQLLDDLGNTSTRIVVTSDLDEYAIASLAAAPVDAYGVGTSLVTGSGAPTAGMVYKLVSRTDAEGRFVPVAKASQNKASVAGRKFPVRRRDSAGLASAEVIGVGREPEPAPHDRKLHHLFVKNGRMLDGWTGPEAVRRARRHHEESLKELPLASSRLQRGEPVLPTHMVCQ